MVLIIFLRGIVLEMNMRLHMNNRLANILFFVLFFICMNAKADTESKLIHKETIENQHRLMEESLRSLNEVDVEGGRGSINDTVLNSTGGVENTSSKDKKDNGFWKGFVNSLSMIFFVEFGDRVLSS